MRAGSRPISGPGRARRERAGHPRHRRRAACRRGRGRDRRRAGAVAAGGNRRRVVARLRRGDFGARTRRSGSARRRDRARAPRDRRGRCRPARRVHPQCRRDLHWRAHAGGDRRLRCRFESRVADSALGAVFLRARCPCFHEAHLDPQVRPGAIARAGRRRDRARRGGGPHAHARSVAIRLNR